MENSSSITVDDLIQQQQLIKAMDEHYKEDVLALKEKMKDIQEEVRQFISDATKNTGNSSSQSKKKN